MKFNTMHTKIIIFFSNLTFLNQGLTPNATYKTKHKKRPYEVVVNFMYFVDPDPRFEATISQDFWHSEF